MPMLLSRLQNKINKPGFFRLSSQSNAASLMSRDSMGYVYMMCTATAVIFLPTSAKPVRPAS